MSSSIFELVHLFFFVYLIPWTSSQQMVSGNKSESRSLRLPPTLQPIHYVVNLRAYLSNTFTIDGYVEINFEVLLTTQEIILHMKDIVTHNNSLQITQSTSDFSSLSIRNQTYDLEREFYIIQLNNELEKGQKYTLKLNFTGSLSSDLEGFYKTSYINEEQINIWIAATQFQATSARRAFPCFDEPQLKATFQVYLGRMENMTALSNMPIKETTPLEPGWVLDCFDTTVPMSTYLLAFVICDFEFIEVTSEHLDTKMKLWARKSILENAEFGRQISEKGLIYLEKFFNLSFPLPKLDLVAVPEMSPNAMENWGLIISRESGLLHSIEEGSEDHMRWVAYLISHELAHQWFGNIVTMKWWTDLWLNEGFATYIGYRVVDHILPEFEELDRFVVKTLQKVMKLDALKSAPPVRVPVQNPLQIREVFGEITYSKGASVIRMMNYFLGEETFQNGLTEYLNELKYKSSDQNDLWDHLTKVAHKEGSLPYDVNVRGIMETWTSQPGFPVVSVSRQGDSVTLKQHPYELTQSNDVGEIVETKKWFIPITWVTQDKPNFEDVIGKVWLLKDNEELNIHGEIPAADKWILMNPKQTGYYRVKYDTGTWNQLIEQLQTNHTVINVVSRAQLLDDALNLAQAGYIEYALAMSVTSYLRHERDFVPWKAALNNFAYLNKMLRTTSVYGAFKAYILKVISPLYESLGSENKESDTRDEKTLRKELTTWACYLEHPNCVEAAVRQVNSWMQNVSTRSPVHTELASAYYCAAVREGSEEVWNFLWKRYLNNSEDIGHKLIMRNALGCSREVWILTRYLEAAFEVESGILRQDASSIYQTVAKSTIGSLLAWNHMKQNWVHVRDYIGTSMFALPNLVETVTSHFNTIQYRDELVWFREKYDGEFGPAKWAMDQAVDLTEANIAWLSSNQGAIETWLLERGFASSLIR